MRVRVCKRLLAHCIHICIHLRAIRGRSGVADFSRGLEGGYAVRAKGIVHARRNGIYTHTSAIFNNIHWVVRRAVCIPYETRNIYSYNVLRFVVSVVVHTHKQLHGVASECHRCVRVCVLWRCVFVRRGYDMRHFMRFFVYMEGGTDEG